LYGSLSARTKVVLTGFGFENYHELE